MSYKHNNLMAMRQSYWNDDQSAAVQTEKLFFQHTLTEHGIFTAASSDDARYFFFSLPSIIIVKGYALGFQNHQVQHMISSFIENHRESLMKKENLKVKFHM